MNELSPDFKSPLTSSSSFCQPLSGWRCLPSLLYSSSLCCSSATCPPCASSRSAASCSVCARPSASRSPCRRYQRVSEQNRRRFPSRPQWRWRRPTICCYQLGYNSDQPLRVACRLLRYNPKVNSYRVSGNARHTRSTEHLLFEIANFFQIIPFSRWTTATTSAASANQ